MNNRTMDEKEASGDNRNKSLSGLHAPLSHQELKKPPTHLSDWKVLAVSERDVKDAFLQYAASKFCYRTLPEKHINIQKLIPLNTFRYRLETFTESRETTLASELYQGGFVDSGAVAPPPAPWEITVDPPPLFTDCEMHIPVPHSYSLENCRNCNGRGTIMCQSCNGAGKKKCTSCSGTGFSSTDDNICSWCSGTGDNRCFSCHSNGWLHCYRCNGSGTLLYHTELSITWKNNILERTADKDTGLPFYYLQEVTGRKILCDEYNSVLPIADFPEALIEDYSKACIAQHRMQFASSEQRVLKQKQTVELVPLTKVDYKWKGKPYSFYIFGNENKVYTKDYPAKCCCCIM